MDDKEAEIGQEYQRATITQKGIKLCIKEISETVDTLTPEQALQLGLKFAIYNNEATFFLARSEHPDHSSEGLRKIYKEQSGYWEGILMRATKGDYLALISALNEHALVNQLKNPDDPSSMNIFGRKLMKLASKIPMVSDGVPIKPPTNPAWMNPDIIQAEDPDITPYSQVPS